MHANRQYRGSVQQVVRAVESERVVAEATDVVGGGLGGLRPYYDAAGITIFHGDSREIVPRLGRFALVLTDPPYGIGKESWDDAYPEWASELFFEAADSVCVIPGIWALGKCIADMGEKYQWTIAGHKSAAMSNGRIGLNKWQPAVLGGKVKRIGQDAFDFSQVDDGKLGHSCQKPLEFVAWLVWKLSKEGDVILDPFCGSGTTGRAAKDLGRKAVLIDREERYCEMSAKRMAQECLSLAGGGSVGEQQQAFAMEPREGSNEKLSD
jgi:site-specific DNA-methyltransferase (adenine-specific)